MALDQLERCSTELQLWFWRNDLLLNPDKSKVAFFGARQRLCRMTLPQTVNIAGSEVKVSGTLKTLDVKLDSSLTFESHINDITRACNFHIRALRHLRRGLTKEVANTMTCSIVGSRIDYCNSLLYGASDEVLDKLQLEFRTPTTSSDVLRHMA